MTIQWRDYEKERPTKGTHMLFVRDTGEIGIGVYDEWGKPYIFGRIKGCHGRHVQLWHKIDKSQNKYQSSATGIQHWIALSDLPHPPVSYPNGI
jgi:hypothetical protein